MSSHAKPPTTQADETAASANGARRPSSPGAPATALRDVGAHICLWTVAILGLAADLSSKEWAFQTLRQGGDRTLIPYVLEFHTTLNPGALFGIGAGRTGAFLIASVLALALVLWMFAQSPPQKRMMHVALGAILAGALGNMYDRVFVQLVQYGPSGPGAPAPRFYVPSESQDGSTILLREYPPDSQGLERSLPGSARDRLPAPVGYVRDFIKIPTRWFGGRELWPWIFNVADMLLVGGVGILALRMLRERKLPAGESEPELDARTEKT